MADERKHLAAFLPCGCIAMIMTVSNPRYGYSADLQEISDWYMEVDRKQKRKKNPLKLTVREIIGKPDLRTHCDACRPPQPSLEM